MTDSVSISPARLAAACRDDARRVVMIAAPLFTAGFSLEAASHMADPQASMLLQPLLSAFVCGGVVVRGRSLLRRVRYPELILLTLLLLVMWCIAQHLPSMQEHTAASTLVMLAVATVGSATLIMPALAALLAIGTTTVLYAYAQTVFIGASGLSALVAPVLVLMVVAIIHLSRRSAIRSVEELRERVARDQYQLEQVNQQLRNLSITDSLTGTLNRRGFDDRLAAELAGAGRGGEPLSVLLLDVDNFKAYNDEFGHPAGDVALEQTAAALLTCCRGSDSVARYGGEEFALILPTTDASGCQRMADRVRSAVATLSGLARPITVSVGAATAPAALMVDSEGTGTGTALVASADSALYRAKEAGRDCAEFTILPMTATATPINSSISTE
ncbi:MAG: GGDEF domain-containing protein [Congregibacter sp.]